MPQSRESFGTPDDAGFSGGHHLVPGKSDVVLRSDALSTRDPYGRPAGHDVARSALGAVRDSELDRLQADLDRVADDVSAQVGVPEANQAA